MDASTLVGETKRLIRDKIQKHEQWLGSGKVKSYEEYKHTTGKIEGLRDGLSSFKEVLDKYALEESDEYSET